MRWYEIVNEHATAGGTGASNIATVVGGKGGPAKGSIGAGFDPTGHHGIYENPKAKKKTKNPSGSPVIKR